MDTVRIPPEHDADRDFELGIPGFRYPDLHDNAGLARLHDAFLAELVKADLGLAREFEAYRKGETLPKPAESELLIRVARQLSAFVARLFRIEAAREALRSGAEREAVIFRFKKDFVKWRCAKRKDPKCDDATFETREREITARGYDLQSEIRFAQRVMETIDREA